MCPTRRVRAAEGTVVKSRFLIASLLLAAALEVSADPLVLRAREREKAGDFESSAALLSSWLEANPGASGSPEVFAAYLRVEQDLPALFDVSRQFLVSAKAVPGAARQFEKIARLFDLAGRIEEARDAYLATSAGGSQEAALVSAFLLSFQMNDAESMSAALQKLAGKRGSADGLLQAISDLQRGDRAAARTSLMGVADQTGNPDLALKALWVLYQTDVNGGDPAAAALSRSKLTSRFASAPETAIAAGLAGQGSKPARAVVVVMPTPLLMEAPSPAAPSPAPLSLAPSTAAPSPAASSPAASLATAPLVPSPKVSVQAGSFLMKENADDLVSELARRGFAPVVVRVTVEGKDRYRVLAGTGLETEAAKATLKKLSDEGFRGFVVADK